MRFPNQKKTKLDARGDGPFQVLERINNISYVIDLRGDYNVSATFNVTDLSPFDVSGLIEDNAETTDSMENPFQEGGNDEDPISIKDQPRVNRPVTRSQVRKITNGRSNNRS